jgi:hypothetical protein
MSYYYPRENSFEEMEVDDGQLYYEDSENGDAWG